ncbi:MAG TPA: hypothetical protein VH061_09115 [Solirubrobacteraceae bacterium]|jgi:hypothetical protein|nr:hypothetical protein [Solirubrobacteraceae bacterium]
MSDPGIPQQPGAGPQPSEEELRAAYEAELSRITATDMIAQATVSLLNIGARRMGPPPGTEDTVGDRDLEQVRDAVDGARALLEILERRMPGELAPLRDALSRLQMAYAAEVGASAPAQGGQPQPGQPAPAPAAEPPQSPQGEEPEPGGPGPAESSGRLWVPGR